MIQTVTSVAFPAVSVHRGVCINDLGAVVFGIMTALIARTVSPKTGIGLCSNTDNVTDLDRTFSLGPDADGYTNDLVSDNTRVRSLTLYNTPHVSNSIF